ncbi:MAG: N-6 DNA methylase [Bacteroidia bacterium]|nr:N-6 DNA methylase [Bacteroidia bacterium]
MTNKETAYQKISELVKRFEEQIDSYKNANYNETLTRRDFIDPFFKALGWDIDNEQGYAEAYREVIHEDRVKIGKATKAPDYSFKLPGGKRLFFVEAKKPSVAVKDDILPAYQIRRYGWSAKLPISIITDFEEFAIYDCTKKPFPTDKASVARIEYLTFRDYLKKFDFIWDTFSKEQVLKGSFDKYVQGNANKKGTATVDKEFLLSLDSWRTYLATSISWNNKTLDEDEINFVVQQTLDRIIFLRIAEDRSIEPYGNLQNALLHGDYYQNLFTIFGEADAKYNSGIFDFKKDKISRDVKIDNKVIKTIIKELYYPESPYEFSVLAVEILGSAYEQFLGKVIRITPGHHAKIEEKPEVRKAGGVYYTPQYVVEYIVKNTVGKLVEGKAPKEICDIKIVDPACGSGSFLIEAYQYLLDWHKDYYTSNGKLSASSSAIRRGVKSDVLTPEGNLTTAEKKRILLNNIYGVDIDVNAVEVTKLSLLLKCMEGETDATINHQFKMFHERVLPTLDNTIKSGNSLVDTDIYASLLDFGEEKKIKPFSWRNGFPEVFSRKTEKPEDELKIIAQKAKQHASKALQYVSELEEKLNTVNEPTVKLSSIGGFDVVIGNPPYGALFSKEELNYIIRTYPESNKFPDSYCAFIVKAKRLLKPNGLLGFIVPNTFCDLENCSAFRDWFLTELKPILFNQTGWAFKDAVVDTLVFIAVNEKSNKNDTLKISIGALTYIRPLIEFFNNELNKIDYRNSNASITFLNKFKSFKSLAHFADIKAGVKLYEKGKGIPPQTEKIVKDKPFTIKKGEVVSREWRPIYRGLDIQRYTNLSAIEFVNYGKWLAAPRSAELFLGEKILMRRTDDKLRSTIDLSDGICVNSCHVIKFRNDISPLFNLQYLLGLLNSKLLQRLFEIQNPQMVGKVFSEIKVIYVERLPIKEINQNNNGELLQYNEIVKLVNQLLKLNEEKAEAKLQSRVALIEGKIDYCENRINEIVYQLYELTDDEIKIVEGK